MRRQAQIFTRVMGNPHRRRSLAYQKFQLITNGMTVGEFTDAYNAVPALPRSCPADQYLRWLIDHGFIEIPNSGYVYRPRGPRAVAMDTSALTPLSTDLGGFTFGVEFEVNMPRGMSRAELGRRVTELSGIEARSEYLNRVARPYWPVVTDGSLDPTLGAELNSPILRGASGLEQAEKVARALKTIGCKVNTKYAGTTPRGRRIRHHGLHVHVGAENEDDAFFRNLLFFFHSNADVLDTMHPGSRRPGGGGAVWCNRVSVNGITDHSTRDEILRLHGGVKYRVLNLSAFHRHGTVEFRQAAGTVEADKVSFWVKFVLRVALAARSGHIGRHRFANLTELLRAIGSTDEEVRFWERRAQILNAQLPAHRRVAAA